MSKYLELETERLITKRLSKDDFDNIYKLLSNSDVMQFIGEGKPQNKKKALETFNLMYQHQQKHGFTLCPTYEKGSDALIGFAGLVHVELDNSNPDIEVGYWFLPEFWGKGYATEVTNAIISWAFENLSNDRIFGFIFPDNIRSQNVLEKAGLRYIGMSTYRGKEVKQLEINRQ